MQSHAYICIASVVLLGGNISLSIRETRMGFVGVGRFAMGVRLTWYGCPPASMGVSTPTVEYNSPPMPGRLDTVPSAHSRSLASVRFHVTNTHANTRRGQSVAARTGARTGLSSQALSVGFWRFRPLCHGGDHWWYLEHFSPAVPNRFGKFIPMGWPAS